MRLGRQVLTATRRLVILTVGGTVLAAGAAMLVLPGPGIATILLGLSVLATEFSWARRLRRWTLAKARNAVADVRHSYQRRRSAALREPD